MLQHLLSLLGNFVKYICIAQKVSENIYIQVEKGIKCTKCNIYIYKLYKLYNW